MKMAYDIDPPICPFTGLSTDERIDDICQYSCTMQSECPLGYSSIEQDFEDDDE